MGVTCLFGQLGGMVEARRDVLASEGRELGQKIIDRVAVRKHADDLVDRDAGAPHEGLAMANVGSTEIRSNGTLMASTPSLPKASQPGPRRLEVRPTARQPSRCAGPAARPPALPNAEPRDAAASVCVAARQSSRLWNRSALKLKIIIPYTSMASISGQRVSMPVPFRKMRGRSR